MNFTFALSPTLRMSEFIKSPQNLNCRKIKFYDHVFSKNICATGDDDMVLKKSNDFQRSLANRIRRRSLCLFLGYSLYICTSVSTEIFELCGVLYRSLSAYSLIFLFTSLDTYLPKFLILEHHGLYGLDGHTSTCLS